MDGLKEEEDVAGAKQGAEVKSRAKEIRVVETKETSPPRAATTSRSPKDPEGEEVVDVAGDVEEAVVAVGAVEKLEEVNNEEV